MTSHDPTPTDKFSFGLWTVGWQGVDPFGGATRPPMDTVHALEKLADTVSWNVPGRRIWETGDI